MRMDTSRMMTILGDTGLYRLTDESFIAGELSAYAAGLSLVYDALEELQRERFLTTAGDRGLRLIESITGRELETAGMEERRTMLLYRLAITQNDFTCAKIGQALTAAGIEASVSEDIDGIYVNVIRLLRPDISEANIAKAAEPFFPAHLPGIFDFLKQSFAVFDEQDMTWSQHDTLDRTWTQFEEYGGK